MKPEEAAYVNLIVLARADRLVTDSEQSLLERCQEVLGVSEEFAEETKAKTDLECVGPNIIKGRPSDRLQILKMMIRVAYADGTIDPKERKLLNRCARSFGIGRIAVTGLFWEIQQELGIRRKLRISQIVAGAAVVVAAVVIWITFVHYGSKTEQQLDENRIHLDELRESMGLERTNAEDALRKVRESQESLELNETALEERIKELDKKAAHERKAIETSLTEEHKKRQALMKAEMDRLRKELDGVRKRAVAFKEIEKEYGGSILLIFIQYELVLDQQRIPRGSMGSGFFVTSSGHIVTNKHVVQPWKFSVEDIMLIDQGFAIDPATLVLAAWPAGTEMRTEQGVISLQAAFANLKHDLEVVGTAPDTFENAVRMLETGVPFQGRIHTYDNGDLAVLKANPTVPVRALPLAAATEKLEKLDPVMVLGFPTGINILETTKAETSPSVGEVRKIEKSIMVTAPIVPGNSGGPLMDIQGRVVGVASKIFGEATLGSCIPAEHILPLLPSAPDLNGLAGGHESTGAYRAALDDLSLADQRATEDADRKVIAEMRARILGIRDEMIQKAQVLPEPEARKKALQEVLKQFGSRWGREAVSLLEEM